MNLWNETLEFTHPYWLGLLLLLPLLYLWLKHIRGNDRPKMIFSQASALTGIKTYKNRLHRLVPWLLLAATGLSIIALARPRTVGVSKHVSKTKGIDIILAVDVSASMLARDFKPNRLEALKKTAIEFVKHRPNDRIGLVLYAGEAFTKVPLTTDKNLLIRAINDIDFFKLFHQIDQGTAIGMGLATAVNRLKDSKAKSKVIILMTDGVNNTGAIDPETALELAKQFGIKVYTIGIGTNGVAPFPVIYQNGQIRYENQPVEIDEQLLKKIARETGGKYYRATGNKELEKIYKEIDKLEKTVIHETRYYNYTELYRPVLGLALVLLLVVWLIRQVILRQIF